ncbi:MAG: hypothetical protein RH948_01620 [Cyclobacteriaceae bacterium]
MKNEELTFEQIESHIAKADLSIYEKSSISAKMVETQPSEVLSKLCGIYRVIRPILMALTKFPIPAKWKQAIQVFIGLMDTLCP